MKTLIVGLFLFSGLVSAQDGPNGNGTGNGGDPLRKLFKQAQLVAGQLSEDILDCELQSNVSPKVRDWILKNHALLSQDIIQTSHKWVVDLQGTCAYTDLALGANVYLSYNECRESTHNLDDAVFTLIHESVHHLGITEETFADEVARAIMETSDLDYCPEAGSPWDANYCSEGPISKSEVISLFPPAATFAAFKTPKVEVRYRFCQEITGCDKWMPIESSILTDYQNQAIKLETRFIVEGGNRTHFNIYSGTVFETVSLVGYDFTSETQTFNNRYGIYIRNSHDKRVLELVGKVASHCMRFSGFARFDLVNGRRIEYQAVLYGRY